MLITLKSSSAIYEKALRILELKTEITDSVVCATMRQQPNDSVKKRTERSNWTELN